MQTFCECGYPLTSSEETVNCPACGKRLETRIRGRWEASDDRLTDEPALGTDTPLAGGRWARDVSLPGGGLCSAKAVGIATFLCGPLAGFMLLARNDGILKKRLRGWGTLLFGVVFSTGLAAGLLLLPDTVSQSMLLLNLGSALLFTIVLVILSLVLHGRQVKAQNDSGASGAPPGELFLRAIGGMVLYFVIIGILIYTGATENRIVIGRSKEVVYTYRVTEAEARALGNFLVAQGVFAGEEEQGVRLDRSGDLYVLSFETDAPFISAQDRAGYRDLAKAASTQVFNNARSGHDS